MYKAPVIVHSGHVQVDKVSYIFSKESALSEAKDKPTNAIVG